MGSASPISFGLMAATNEYTMVPDKIVVRSGYEYGKFFQEINGS
jgi:hypothetical protein